MKRNGILLIILSSLLVFTYWYEELGGQKRKSKEKEAKALFQNKNLGELRSISFPKFGLVVKDGKYFTRETNYPADKRKTDKLIEVLGNLEMISILDKKKIIAKRKDFFPQEDLIFTFNFVNGEVSYKLGAKLEYSQDFYIEIAHEKERNLIIVKDTSPQYGLYQDKSLERSPQKFDRLKYILGLSEKDMFDTRPFKNLQGNIEKISLESFRNRKFEIDFSKYITKPPVFEKLSYKINFFEEFKKSLENLYANNIFFDPKIKDLSDPVSSIWSPTKATLYKKYKGRGGYFLLVDGDKDLYEIDRKDSNLFFTNVQDFWNKEIIDREALKLPAIFHFPNKPKVSVKVSVSGPFSVHTFDAAFKVKQDSFKKIYSLLLNPAERMSDLDFYLKEHLKKSLFQIQLNDLMFKIFKVKNELLFVNERDKLVYIYEVGDQIPIDVKFEDYFHPKE